jgi:hypothetical protein
VFTRIVTIVVLIAFTFTTTQCTRAVRVPREEAISELLYVTSVTLHSGEEVLFADPGGYILRRAETIIGQSAGGVPISIPLDDVHRATLVEVRDGLRTEREVHHNGLLRACVEGVGEKVVAAVLPSGKVITFDRYGAAVSGPPWVLDGFDTHHVRQQIPLDDVLYVQVARFDALSSFFAFVAITGLVGGGVVLLIAATKESCPFIYAYDGENYVLDAEPLGGAICKGLERTDLSRLEHLRPVDSEYRLCLRNEVDEFQHLDRCDLLLVDHPAGCEVVPDPQGSLLLIAGAIAPASVTDESGRDVTSFFQAEDGIAWQSHMAAGPAAESTSPAQSDATLSGSAPPALDATTASPSFASPALASAAAAPDPFRQSLTFRFPRPAAVDHARLVVNAGATLWGSNMIREMLALRGEHLDEWYADVNAGGPSLAQLNEFLLREELYNLKVHVQVAGGWEEQGFIFSGGPLVCETRALPLDLTRVMGDSLVVRVDPPFGFWTIDRFGLAGDVRPAPEPVVIAPRGGADDEGTVADRAGIATDRMRAASDHRSAAADDVRATAASMDTDIASLLAAADGRYHPMPEVGDAFTLRFSAPPAVAGLERTVFLRTTGYYEIHVPPDLPDRTLELVTMASTPGGMTRYALHLYREWQAEMMALGTGR